MAKRKQNVVVQVASSNLNALYVFIDSGMVSDLEKVEGVVKVDKLSAIEYAVHFDPRYDKTELIADIEALNKDSDIPDVWKGA